MKRIRPTKAVLILAAFIMALTVAAILFRGSARGEPSESPAPKPQMKAGLVHLMIELQVFKISMAYKEHTGEALTADEWQVMQATMLLDIMKSETSYEWVP